MAKKLPFTRDDYFRLLDSRLSFPAYGKILNLGQKLRNVPSIFKTQKER